MTYFKRRRSILDHVHVMDPRILHAAIDPPHWWQQQRELVAARETVIDFSAEAVGECSDPLERVGIRVVTGENRPFVAHIAEQHGIRGLALNGRYELRLPNLVDQVDILIAHFGQAPKLKVRAEDKQVVTTVADDRPRHVELLRLLGRGIDCVSIDAPGDILLVQIVFPGHTRGDMASAMVKKIGKRSRKPSKES
jgi:hypothetical protein